MMTPQEINTIATARFRSGGSCVYDRMGLVFSEDDEKKIAEKIEELTQANKDKN